MNQLIAALRHMVDREAERREGMEREAVRGVLLPRLH